MVVEMSKLALVKLVSLIIFPPPSQLTVITNKAPVAMNALFTGQPLVEESSLFELMWSWRFFFLFFHVQGSCLTTLSPRRWGWQFAARTSLSVSLPRRLLGVIESNLMILHPWLFRWRS